MCKPILALFATVTGNAECAANTAVAAAAERGFAPTAVNIADLDPASLASNPRVLVLASTTGDGEPPVDAEMFRDWLTAQTDAVLAGVHYSVYALGDTAYEQYCAFGKLIDEEFERLGARRVAPRFDSDVDFESALPEWLGKSLSELEKV